MKLITTYNPEAWIEKGEPGLFTSGLLVTLLSSGERIVDEFLKQYDNKGILIWEGWSSVDNVLGWEFK